MRWWSIALPMLFAASLSAASPLIESVVDLSVETDAPLATAMPGERRWRWGGEIQVYPAGVIGAGRASVALSQRERLLFYVGYNLTDRGDFGEHDDEEGGGPGFGLAWRRYFSGVDRDGWYAGARADLWFLEIDWRDDEPARSGRTDVLVLQPTAVGGRAWVWDDLVLDLGLALGAEVNLDTDGEDVGEGAILLGGLGFEYAF